MIFDLTSYRDVQDLKPHIHLTDSDFASITNDGKLCDEGGSIRPAEFEAAIRQQLRLYAQARPPIGCVLDHQIDQDLIRSLAVV